MGGKGQDQYDDMNYLDPKLVEDNRPKGLKDRVVDGLTSQTALFIYLLIACISIGLLVPMWFLYYLPLDVDQPVYTRGSCMIATQYRMTCLVGQENVTDLQCALAGCCWYDTEEDSDQGPNKCFHSLPASYTYKMYNSSVDASSIAASLTGYSFADKSAGRAIQTPYNTSAVPRISASVSCPQPEHALLELGPPKVYATSDSADTHPVIVNGSVLTVASNTGPDWDFFAVVSRTSTGQSLVDTRMGATIFSDRYTEFTVVPASTVVYGLGQSFHSSLRRTFDWPPRAPLFGRSKLFSEGAHPFYMCIEPSGDVHGVYLETSAPVEVQLLPGPSITFRLLDSRVKLHVLAGPTPADVTDQYTQLVGRPRLPPLWSLGFHLCREGDPDSFEKVVDDMSSRSIPFESDCVDATLLPHGFEASDTFRQGAEKLHGMGRHAMAVVTPHLPLYLDLVGEEADPYPPFEDADEQGILLRDQNDTDNMYGELHDPAQNRTWNVSYVDYTNPDTVSWAKPLYNDLIDDNVIDGFYLMRNSPANDAEDACNDSLPFVPNLGDSKTLSNGSVCMLSKQASGSRHLTTHNRYGQDQTRMVRDATADSHSNLLLTSTSTAPGSGALGGHFATGLSADWTSLPLALVQTLELGLYGVPQGGYPVCGSRNSTSISSDDTSRLETLCLLWYQLLPYLPLAVSHYEAGHLPRNPTQMSDSFKLSVLAQISQRYVFIPYHFTLLVEASLTGVPPLRPLWYEFAQDNATWNIDQQMLLGPSLLLAPALNENQGIVDLYLPGSCWYEYFQGFRPKAEVGPGWVTLPVPADQTLIYQRAASVIFNQQTSESLEQQRQNGTYSATIALSCEGGYEASGTLYLPGNDDDIAPGAVTLAVQSNSTVVIESHLSPEFCSYYSTNNYTSTLVQIKVFGILEDVANVTTVVTSAAGGSKTDDFPVNQSQKPPSLLIEDFEMDWCRDQKAELTWNFSED